jgi:inorganic pyrophosphatase
LRQEYIFLSFFLFFFAIVLVFAVDQEFNYKPYTTFAFIIGCCTSISCGYIGMRVAVYTNVRTTKECCEDIGRGFVVAYRGGQVLGFVLVGLAILILQLVIIIYKAIYLDEDLTVPELEAQAL